jgi:hypothetical protein
MILTVISAYICCLGASSLDDCSAQVFPYNIFAYCSICRVDCKFARNKKIYIYIYVVVTDLKKTHTEEVVPVSPHVSFPKLKNEFWLISLKVVKGIFFIYM